MSTEPKIDDDIIALLPFYLSGRIEADDRARVERWIASDADAMSILAKVEDERAAVITSNEEIVAPAGGLQRLMSDIANTPQEFSAKTAVRSGWSSLLANIMRPFEAAPKELAWGLCGLLLMVSAVQTGLLVSGNQGTSSGFELASGEKIALAGRAIVMFAPDAKLADMQSALAGVNAVIVNGPTASGQYIIGFESGETLPPLAERFAILEKNTSLISFIAKMGDK